MLIEILIGFCILQFFNCRIIKTSDYQVNIFRLCNRLVYKEIYLLFVILCFLKRNKIITEAERRTKNTHTSKFTHRWR